MTIQDTLISLFLENPGCKLTSLNLINRYVVHYTHFFFGKKQSELFYYELSKFKSFERAGKHNLRHVLANNEREDEAILSIDNLFDLRVDDRIGILNHMHPRDLQRSEAKNAEG